MDDLDKNPYLLDIHSQPQALRLALAKTDLAPLEALTQALNAGRFDRILLTGMGASYYGLYPAWLHLAAAGLPAVWVDSAELVHHAPAFVTRRTLLWIASQSGHSAEIVTLLRQSAAHPPAGLLAMTNDLSSPLAQATGEQGSAGLRALLPLYAEPESTPSTRTYLHTLAISQLAALYLAQAELAPHLAALQAAADGIAAYLQDWRDQMQHLREAIESVQPELRSIVLVGRGLSLASAFSGALNLQEAAKLPALGLQAAEFRHGPLEMAGPGLTALIFAGENALINQLSVNGVPSLAGMSPWGLNHKLWHELRALGVNAWLMEPPSPPAPLPSRERGESAAPSPRKGEGWGDTVAPSPQWGEDRGEGGILPLPSVSGIGLPLAEIIPIQLLCVYLSQRAGVIPGTFRNIGKVTTEE
jgi:glucosamine--fructose-6-phosphate aminotransferase (isomerizing)